MKKKNKIYLPLEQQGIKKAWDKAVIFSTKEDTGYNGELQMVVYWQNKPFEYWPVEDAFNLKGIRRHLYCMLEHYGKMEINSRVISKKITKYFLEFEAAEKVVSYKRGGVLIPEV